MKSQGQLKLRGNIYWMNFTFEGQRIRESTKTSNKRIAERVLLKKQAELLGQISLAPTVVDVPRLPIPVPETPKETTGMTIDELRNAWIQYAADKKSLRNDITRSAAWVKYLGKDLPIDQITPQLILGFTELKKNKLRPATINRHLVLLKSMLYLAEKRGHTTLSPFTTVKLLDEDNERDRIMTPEEFQLMKQHAKDDLTLALTIAYYTAMREGEIASLQWKNVEWNEQVLVFKSNKTKKNKPSKRVVPLHTEVYNLLKAKYEIDKPDNLNTRILHINANTVSHQFGSLVKKLGLDDLVFHDLRHTAITRFRRAGVDLLTIKKISGHKTMKMLERYNTIDDADLKDAVSRLDKGRPTS